MEDKIKNVVKKKKNNVSSEKIKHNEGHLLVNEQKSDGQVSFEFCRLSSGEPQRKRI